MRKLHERFCIKSIGKREGVDERRWMCSICGFKKMNSLVRRRREVCFYTIKVLVGTINDCKTICVMLMLESTSLHIMSTLFVKLSDVCNCAQKIDLLSSTFVVYPQVVTVKREALYF